MLIRMEQSNRLMGHRCSGDSRIFRILTLFVLILATIVNHGEPVFALHQQSSSLLINTQWKTRLDVGLQPGTWMPKRFPGWAESGARLGLDLDVEFTDTPSLTGETLVGPKDSTFQMKVLPSSQPSRFVSERGEEFVDFSDVGGWCIQRPTNSVQNSNGGFVKPEGLLRFWIDCKSGAKRNDVEIFPDTRLFFSTGVWDDPTGAEQLDQDYRDVLDKLQTMVDTAREEKNSDKKKNILEELQSFQKQAKNAEIFDKLKREKDSLEGALPPLGATIAANGVQMAPTGSLVIKGNGIPDWLPGSEYLILGTFSSKAIDPTDMD